MMWMIQISSSQQIFFLPPPTTPAALKAASVSELTQISAANETATFMDFLQSVKMTDKHWEH